jgi:hypothetical protein
VGRVARMTTRRLAAILAAEVREPRDCAYRGPQVEMLLLELNATPDVPPKFAPGGKWKESGTAT